MTSTVIDSGAPGFGASSRSGGMVGHGHRLSYAKLEARYGTPKAKAILREGVAAFDFPIGLIERERIDAKFARVGRFRGCAIRMPMAGTSTSGRRTSMT